jgi:hypothetical protein
MGYVPTAMRCNPYGQRMSRVRHLVHRPKLARKLVADRRAGRPMPWWGKPEPAT